MRRPSACLAALIAVCAARGAAADAPFAAPAGARDVAHAGGRVVSADDGAALLMNPAGLARRGEWRAQVGFVLADREASYATDELGPAAPAVHDRAAVTATPALSLQGGLGERVTIAAGFLAPVDLAHATASPGEYLPEKPDADDYPSRYAGTRFRLSARGAGAGASVRALPWLAIGASVMAFRVELTEDRMIWGGTPSAGPLANLPPGNDMTFTVNAADGFVPAAALGVIVAPLDAPVELGASLFWSADAELDGPATLSDSRGDVDGVPFVRADVAAGAGARTTLAMPLVVRAGARFLTSRAALEVAAEYRRHRADAPAWSVDGITLTATTLEPAPSAALTTVPLGTAFTDSTTLGSALDVDFLDGSLTATVGYAWSRAAVPRTALSVLHPDLDGHTLSLGVELRVEGATATLGLARREGVARAVAAGESRVRVVHPLAEGDVAAAAGRYDGSATVVGFGVELTY